MELQGNLEIVTTNSPVIGIISSENPQNDFHFELSCYNEDKVIGHCNFNLSMMGNETLFDILCQKMELL